MDILVRSCCLWDRILHSSREWSEARELDWYLLAEEKHVQMKNYVRELLHLYQDSPALYQTDDNWKGFEWINADDSDRSIFSFVRPF